MTAHPFLIPLLLQAGFGFSAVKSGLFTLPAVAGSLVLMLVLTRLLNRFNHRRLLILNSILLLVFFCSFYWQAFQLIIPLLLLQQITMGFLSSLQTAADEFPYL